MEISHYQNICHDLHIAFLTVDENCEKSKFLKRQHEKIYGEQTFSHVTLTVNLYTYSATIGVNEFRSIYAQDVARIRAMFLPVPTPVFLRCERTITWLDVAAWSFRRGFNCVNLIQHTLGEPRVWMTPDEYFVECMKNESLTRVF